MEVALLQCYALGTFGNCCLHVWLNTQWSPCERNHEGMVAGSRWVQRQCRDRSTNYIQLSIGMISDWGFSWIFSPSPAWRNLDQMIPTVYFLFLWHHPKCWQILAGTVMPMWVLVKKSMPHEQHDWLYWVTIESSIFEGWPVPRLHAPRRVRGNGTTVDTRPRCNPGHVGKKLASACHTYWYLARIFRMFDWLCSPPLNVCMLWLHTHE